MLQWICYKTLKGLVYMTNNDYTRNILNIKDVNVNFYENCLETRKFKGIDTKVFKAFLTYSPTHCDCCGHINNSSNDIIKWNWKRNCIIKIPKVSNFNSIILLDKQRFYCKHCNKTFTAKSSFINNFSNISNNTFTSIKLDLMNKISEKDISIKNNVSHNTVNRIINSLSKTTVLPGTLPTSFHIDEFKATIDTIGKMAFSIVNSNNGKVFDILESRKSNYLSKYFLRFPKKQRDNVKFIVMDMFAPYYTLFKHLFPNATIITDKFHVVALINNALKFTRIKAMKNDKINYNKLKHYWKLIQKDENKLNDKDKYYSHYFKKHISEAEIVEYLINTNRELKATYKLYQALLKSIRNKDISLFSKLITSNHSNISDYMITALKSLNKFSYHIINSFKYNLNNGIIEGINNLIKCIKRIAFGYRSFYHFKTRIMLICGIYKY